MARDRTKPFPYRAPPEAAAGRVKRVPVLVIGAGPVGLAAAIDLALHGVACVLCDDNDAVSVGSRAICWSKRTLEIFDRLGVGERMVEKGVTWKVGRLFHRDREVYAFDLLPEPGHKMPAFINLQQYYVEQYLVERCAAFPELIELRWKNKVVGLAQTEQHATARVETPHGSYAIEADYVLACDGALSSARGHLGLSLEPGRIFDERFLICDVEMAADFPSERWFWFEPPFHAGQSALLHKQPDNIYRIDLQLGPDADPEAEKQPERVVPRIKAMLGEREFALDWVSVYRFQCRRLARFVHGRVIFAGDAAHLVSPFGARGGNGGIQDVDNLCWKLAAVLNGEAGPALIDSYDEERIRAADENILHASRSTRFMSPRGRMERAFRDAVLDLARDLPFARRLVNSGRLSTPCSLAGLSLQTPAEGAAGIAPGLPCPDAPDGDGWLLDKLGGAFTLLRVGGAALDPCAGLAILHADSPLARARYGDGLTYLIRPDQHVAARFAKPSPAAIAAARERALARR
jgi:3-(3-hydroxy-phenyl)propionate hydroxylase